MVTSKIGQFSSDNTGVNLVRRGSSFIFDVNESATEKLVAGVFIEEQFRASPHWYNISFEWLAVTEKKDTVFEVYLEHGEIGNRDYSAYVFEIKVTHAFGKEYFNFFLNGDEVNPKIGIRFKGSSLKHFILNRIYIDELSGEIPLNETELTNFYQPYVTNHWFADDFMKKLIPAVGIWYQNILPDGGDAIDVGANKGLHTSSMQAAIKSNSDRVLAIEPHPELFTILEKNYSGTECVLCENVLVGNYVSNGTEFTFSDQYHELGSARPNYIEDFFPMLDAPLKTKLVRMETIDTLVQKHDLRPSFIKIDVEGFELEALLGSNVTLSRFRPIIAFEFNVSSTINNSYLLHDLFEHFNYLIFDCFGNVLTATTWARPNVCPIDRIALPIEKLDYVKKIRPQLKDFWSAI